MLNKLNKPTMIIGASSNPERYSYKACISLLKHNHSVFPLGIKAGKINDLEIILDRPIIENVDTVSLYVSEKNISTWEEYILALKPKRIIFNPGTENLKFSDRATSKGIECLEACTLVMLSIGNY